MRSRVMMIVKIARQHAAQVTLAHDDNVIQTFAADRSDETLRVGILPGRSRRSDGLCHIVELVRCDLGGAPARTSRDCQIWHRRVYGRYSAEGRPTRPARF